MLIIFCYYYLNAFLVFQTETRDFLILGVRKFDKLVEFNLLIKQLFEKI